MREYSSDVGGSRRNSVRGSRPTFQTISDCLDGEGGAGRVCERGAEEKQRSSPTSSRKIDREQQLEERKTLEIEGAALREQLAQCTSCLVTPSR